MDQEVHQQYMELLQELLATAADMAQRVKAKVPSRQRLQQAFKRPDWAPRDKQDWDHHVAVTNDEDETIGYLDTEDDLVEMFEDETPRGYTEAVEEDAPETASDAVAEQETEVVPQVQPERLANVAGAGWVATQEQGRGQGARGRVLDDEAAHEWLNGHGWDVVTPEGVKPSTTSGQAEDEERAAFLDGVDLAIPDEAGKVVARNATVTTKKPQNVRVAGVATVNGTTSSSWDEMAEDATARESQRPRERENEQEAFAVESSAPRGEAQADPEMR